MKYIVYTTSQPSAVQPLVDAWAREISKTKGRGIVTVDVVRKVLRRPKIEEDTDGDLRFPWEYFTRVFPRGDYDGVIFHFTPYYRRKWDMSQNINGSRNQNNRQYPEFWVCSELDTKAKGYSGLFNGYNGLLEIHRLLFHEQAHYDEDVDDEVGNVLTQDSVHTVDYKLRQIHKYHLLVDYRGREFKHKVNSVINDIMKLAKKFL